MRPILTITVGYLIGIIYGLYFKKSIVFIFAVIYIIYLIYRYTNNGLKILKYIRYIKLINKKAMVFLIFSAIISNTYLLSENGKYNDFYEHYPEKLSGKAIVISNVVESNYTNKYIIKVTEGVYKNKKFILSLKKNSINLSYGDLISFEGEYIIPDSAKNYKGFNYREYLKTKRILGTVKNSKLRIIEHKDLNRILILANSTANSMKDKIESLLPQTSSSILEGILLGDKTKISEETIESFKSSNISHILSVSGMHVSYIVLGVSLFLGKISKKWANIIAIIFLIIFMFVTNFSLSVVRASIMGIIALSSNLFYCKSDILNSMAISILITLVINPFYITEIGMQLSYLGTLGIIFFNKLFEEMFCKKLNKKLSKVLAVSFSAQVLIMPIIAINFNTISFTFFISNCLISLFMGPIIILGFTCIFVSFISFEIAKMLSIFLNFGINIVIYIASICSKIPFSTVYIKTPYVITIFSLYTIIFLISYLIKISKKKSNLKFFERKILNYLTLKNIIKIVAFFLIIIILFNVLSYLRILIFPNLKIYFIDVGQGDSCLIITPTNKKILIDGGEGQDNSLLMYLLDRRITKIDYIIISHFDSDHVGRFVYSYRKAKSRTSNYKQTSRK